MWESFKKIGVCIAMDDFGTGYSNLKNIGRLSSNTLKIDRIFTMQALKNEYEHKLLDHIIDMIHSLNLKVVIEGIETKEELESYPHLADTQVGDVMFEDVNGDQKIDADDRTIIGNNMPDFTWGMTHSFTYKNFDASISLQGVVGNEVLHLGRRFYTQGEGNQNQLKEMMGRWQSESNPGNGWIPRANSQPTGQNNAISSRWVENGSFLRINNLTVGYTLPEAFTKKCSIQRARVYVSTQNLLTITSYSGYNPETSFKEDNVTAPGTDYGMYPLYRTCTFGINVTF